MFAMKTLLYLGSILFVQLEYCSACIHKNDSLRDAIVCSSFTGCSYFVYINPNYICFMIIVVNEPLMLTGCLRYQLHLLIGFWAYFNCFCEKGVRARHLVGKNVTFSPVREMCRMPEFLLKILTGSVWSSYFLLLICENEFNFKVFNWL